MKKGVDSDSKLLIFDFDGTIADTKTIYYNAIYNEMRAFGLSYEKIGRVIDLGMSLKKTLKKMGFSSAVRWFLHKKIVKNVKRESNKVKKCKDVDLIKSIKTRKILVTNSLKEFAVPIIKNFKLKKEFKEIYGAEDFLDKAEFISDYLNKRGIRKENCYYIGDRAADIKVAKEIKCKGVIISGKCAWDSRKELLEESPEFIIGSLKDIKKIVN